LQRSANFRRPIVEDAIRETASYNNAMRTFKFQRQKTMKGLDTVTTCA